MGVTLLEEDEEKGANWELVDGRKGQPKGRQNIYWLRKLGSRNTAVTGAGRGVARQQHQTIQRLTIT